MGTSISTVMSSAIPTMVDVALKGAVLLALAGLATAALWRASAAVRHLVWSLTMAGLLALPLLSALLPQWRVLPQWSAMRAPAPAAARAPAPLTPTVTPPPENTPTVAPETAFMSTPVQSPATRANSSPSAGKPARPWSDWLLPFWIAGAALMLLPVVVGRLALWRLGRSARLIRSGSWTALLQTLMQQMRLRRGVILLETDRPVMPMAWGIRRARVLVPAESENWTSERRRAVLLHEIAHVRRRDCLTQLLTNLACSMHWFNPLAWLARRRMVAERERACDDLVLAAGFEPSDYARHLLQIASSLRGGFLTSAAAIAMARPSKLEGRLLAVLDGKRSRRGLTRSLVLAGLVLTLGIAVPLACLRPQGTDAKSPEGGKEASTSASGFLAAFPGGGTIELVGVSYNPSKGKPWWKPDGTPLSPGFVTSGASVSHAPGSKDQPREFVMRAEGLPEGSSSPTWKLEPTGNSAGGQVGVMGDDGKLAADLNMIAVEIPKSAKSVTVKIGVATGDWQDVDQCPPGETLFSGRQEFGVSFAEGYEQQGKATMTVSHNLKDQDVRLIAVDLKGGEHASSGTRSGGVAFFSQITATFDLPLDHVKVFRLQSRPYQWVEFHDVALEPNEHTDGSPAPAEKPEEKASAVEAVFFGPVIEQTVGSMQLVDFDKGLVLEKSSDVPPGEPWKMEDLAKKSGADAFFTPMTGNVRPGPAGPQYGTMHCCGMAVQQLQSDDWSSLTAAKLGEMAASLAPMVRGEFMMPLHDPLPQTILIRTRQGGIGLLQVVGFMKDPWGVKFRYKLAMNQGAPLIMVPGGMIGTWLFENPLGDDEQMSVFTDGRVLTFYSNGHRDAVHLQSGMVNRPEYQGGVEFGPDHREIPKGQLETRADGSLLETLSGGTIPVVGLAKIWKMIDLLPRERLMIRLVEPKKGSPLEGFVTPLLPLAEQHLQFGPVVERSLEGGQLIDFDAGRLVGKIERVTHDVLEKLDARVKETGADAWLRNTGGLGGRPNHWIMHWCEMAATPVGSDAWSDMSAESVTEIAAKFQTRSVVTVLNAPAQTYVLRTREGGIGLLRIVGFTEDPPAVKLQYKMIRQQGIPSGEAPAVPAEKTTPTAPAENAEENPGSPQTSQIRGEPVNAKGDTAAARPAPKSGEQQAAEALTYTGVVTDKETRKPIQGATVTVRRMIYRDSPYERRTLDESKCETDAQGKYTFTISAEQAAERYMYIELDVTHPDYVGQFGFGYALSMILKNEKLGERPFFENVSLTPAAPVTGIVVAPDGKPLAGVKVIGATMSRPRDFTSEVLTETTTDQQGFLRLNLPKDGDGIFWLLPKEYAASAHVVGLKRGDLGRIILEKGILLRGRVVDEQGRPVNGVWVEAKGGQNPPMTEFGMPLGLELWRVSRSDGKGEFAMPPLSAGQYDVQPSEYSLDPEERDHTRRPLPGVFVPLKATLKDGESDVSVEIHAVPAVVVEGQYYDSAGKPRSGHEPHLWGRLGKNDFFNAQGFVDATGRFTIQVPKGIQDAKLTFITNEHGALRVRISKDAPLSNQNRDIDLGTLEKDVRGIEVVSYNAPILLVMARTEDGTPIKDFTVEVKYAKRPPAEPGVRFLREGDCSFEKQEDGRERSMQLLPDEEFTLTIKADRYQPKSEKLTLPEGAIKELDVKLQKQPFLWDGMPPQ